MFILDGIPGLLDPSSAQATKSKPTLPQGVPPQEKPAEQAGQDDIDAYIAAVNSDAEKTSTSTTTTSSSGEPQGEGTVSTTMGRYFQKGLTFIGDTYNTILAGKLVKYAFTEGGTLPKCLQAGGEVAAEVSDWGSRLSRTPIGNSGKLGRCVVKILSKTSKLTSFLKAGNFLSKANPYLGGILAAVDCVSDWINWGTSESPRTILEKELELKGIDPLTINAIAALGDQDISVTANYNSLVALLSRSMPAQQAKALADKVKEQKIANDSKFSSAIVNTGFTGAGAVIGGVLGTFIPIPGFGTLLGVCVGASVGNLIAMGVNAVKNNSFGIGGFFKGFFGGN